jgi:hypothetical protein
MIKNDFRDGGFPINSQNPVLCVTKEGDIYVAYDRFGLGTAIKAGKVFKCVGIWPGKKNTDVFPLNPEFYTAMPPSEYRDIDNALSIMVKYVSGEFSELRYKTMENVEVLVKDVELLKYITSLGLKHTSVHE